MALISYVTRVHFADGIAAEALASEVQRLRLRRLGVIAMPTTTEPLRTVAEWLPPNVVVVPLPAPSGFPTTGAARTLAERCANRRIDGLIAIGSDDVLDLAKAVALALRHRGALEAYACSAGGVTRIGCLPPVIAIPLVAGRGAAVSDRLRLATSQGVRLGFCSPRLVPTVAIYDTTLIRGGLATDAGAASEALAQGVECYLAAAFNPPADALVLDGVARVARSAARALDAPNDLAMRRDLVTGAMNAALALQKGVGVAHALAHALEALAPSGLPLGALHAILLPHVVAFNAPAVGAKMERLAAAIGAESAIAVPARLARLATALGLPTRLASLGLEPASLLPIARLAAADEASGTNPRRVEPADALALLHRAM